MTFELILRDHIARYPLMQAEDAYKLLHQACMGSEHAVGDLDSVRRWMTREVAEQIWPGHGAGSACSRALGAVPSTTLGYEKRFNPAFRIEDEEAFVRWLLEGQPEPPKYFARMKQVNKAGPALLSDLRRPRRLGLLQIDRLLSARAQVFDFRDREAFESVYLPGTISVPAPSPTFLTCVGWLVDYRAPVHAIVPTTGRLKPILRALRAIGVDDIAGYATDEQVIGITESLPTITSTQLAERLPRNGLLMLDVRNRGEYDEMHIRGALHIPLGYLPDRLHEVPRDREVVAHCASGYRSHVAVSLLRREGFDKVVSLKDGKEVWSRHLPTESRVSAA